jgi:hypothetical protein
VAPQHSQSESKKALEGVILPVRAPAFPQQRRLAGEQNESAAAALPSNRARERKGADQNLIAIRLESLNAAAAHDADTGRQVISVAPPSARGFGLFGFSRLDPLALGNRPDAERPRGFPGGRGLRLGSEEGPAIGRELGLVPDHAGGDAIDVRNLGTAKTKRIAAASLLLFGRIGLPRRRQHRNRKRGCEHQTEMKNPEPDSNHEFPPERVESRTPEQSRHPLCHGRIVGEPQGIRKQAVRGAVSVRGAAQKYSGKKAR